MQLEDMYNLRKLIGSYCFVYIDEEPQQHTGALVRLIPNYREQSLSSQESESRKSPDRKSLTRNFNSVGCCEKLTFGMPIAKGGGAHVA